MAFECDECNASYSVRKSLLNHKRLKHGNPQEFACQYCVYTSTKKDNLEQHVRSQHEKIKEICETCRKGFSDRSNLNRHVRIFHGEAVQGTKRKATEPLVHQSKKIIAEVAKELKCGVCLKEFKEVKNLNKHVRKFHGEKTLKCNSCSYTTNDTSQLQRHTEKHDQDAKKAMEEVYSCNHGPNEDEAADEEDSCFGGVLVEKMWKEHASKDILFSLEEKKTKIKKACWNMLKKEKGIQFYLTIQCTMMKTDRNGEIMIQKPYFW